MSGNYTDAQKASTLKHLKTLKEIRFRVKPDEYIKYQEAAKKLNYDSMRSFFLAAIEEKIQNDMN